MGTDVILSPLRISDLERIIQQAVRSVIESTPSINQERKELLSTDEAAELIDRSKHTLYKLVGSKEIPFSKPRNGKLLFHRSELMKWVEASHRVTKRQSRQALRDSLNS
jgi:excisionase family DNA binding protein